VTGSKAHNSVWPYCSFPLSLIRTFTPASSDWMPQADVVPSAPESHRICLTMHNLKLVRTEHALAGYDSAVRTATIKSYRRWGISPRPENVPPWILVVGRRFLNLCFRYLRAISGFFIPGYTTSNTAWTQLRDNSRLLRGK